MKLSFYESDLPQAFRFGDIVTGFTLAAPVLAKPQTPPADEYKLDISHPRYTAVLSPCCSIGDSKILLSPLLPIRAKWFANPYFLSDLTRINRKMTAQESMPPQEWQKLLEPEKTERANAAPCYAEVDFFVYDQHPLLPTYPVTLRGNTIPQVGYYMVDFRKLYRVNCTAIRSPQNCPLDVKILQLSISARAELREKLVYFFNRIPAEDSIPQTATPPAGPAFTGV